MLIKTLKIFKKSLQSPNFGCIIKLQLILKLKEWERFPLFTCEKEKRRKK